MKYPLSNLEEGLVPTAPPSYFAVPVAQVAEAAPLSAVAGYSSVGCVVLEPSHWVSSSSPNGEYDRRVPLALQHFVSQPAFDDFVTPINTYVSKYHWLRHVATAVVVVGFVCFGVGGFLMTESDGKQPAVLIVGFVLFVAGGVFAGYAKKLAMADYQSFVTRRCDEASARFAPVVFRYQVHFGGLASANDFGQHNDHHHRLRPVYRQFISIEYPTN